MNNDICAIAIDYHSHHQTPENDDWCGSDFAAWRNVAKAKPLFPGHYQLHLPADLGFYHTDLYRRLIRPGLLSDVCLRQNISRYDSLVTRMLAKAQLLCQITLIGRGC